MRCEMCGKEAELYTASIEGVTMTVCKRCASHGKILKKPQPVIKPRPKRTKPAAPEEKEVELVEAVVDDYAKKIRNARTKTGMTQKEFAQKINEKESLLHKMETGSFKPSIPLAKKLGKMLHIKLVEEKEEEKIKMQKTEKSGAVTIGDLIKL